MADQLAYLPLWEKHLVAKNGNFRFLLLECSYWQINWQIYPPWDRHLVAKNGILDF